MAKPKRTLAASQKNASKSKAKPAAKAQPKARKTKGTATAATTAKRAATKSTKAKQARPVKTAARPTPKRAAKKAVSKVGKKSPSAKATPIPAPKRGAAKTRASLALTKGVVPDLSTLRYPPMAHPDTLPKGKAGKSAKRAKAAKGLTYAASGVDIAKEDKSIEAITRAASFVRKGFGAPLGKIGHFAGLIGFGDHALVMCTDGVGSKVEIASAMKRYDTVGIDCVAMNVNDALCVGAEPLAFVDYLAVEAPDEKRAEALAKSLDEGCRQANCTLVGGETATLPGLIKGFDIAGTCLGYVHKDRIVDGKRIRAGNVILGLASTGIHSNGYSLARKAFEGTDYKSKWAWIEDRDNRGKTVGDVLLTPTRIYVREIVALLKAGIDVRGLSHITGGGLRKLRRINQKVRYVITDPLPVPSVFKRIQQLGKVAPDEMYRTFNMGMGFAVVVAAEDAARALNVLRANVDYEVKVVGHVEDGRGVVHPVGGTH